jgi:translation initiation factor IF-3
VQLSLKVPPGGGRPPIELLANERIRVPRVKLIDEKSAMLGEMPTDQARHIARERGLDLVLIAADARPPVCKLLDLEQFQYTNKKKRPGK